MNGGDGIYGKVSIQRGSLTEAAVDFTGGVSERISLKAKPFLEVKNELATTIMVTIIPELSRGYRYLQLPEEGCGWRVWTQFVIILFFKFLNRCLVGCSSEYIKESLGLVSNHAFTVTGVSSRCPGLK